MKLKSSNIGKWSSNVEFELVPENCSEAKEIDWIIGMLETKEKPEYVPLVMCGEGKSRYGATIKLCTAMVRFTPCVANQLPD